MTKSHDLANSHPSSVSIIGSRGYPSYYGGFETAVRKVAPILADNGWEVTVYSRTGATLPADPSRDPRIRSVYTRGVESKSISTLSYGLTSSLHTMWKKPDVALVMNVANGFFLPLLRLRGIHTVVNVDGIEWDRAKWGFLAKQMFKLGARLTAVFANQLIFDSREIARRWNEDFDRSGTFIPYGGDILSNLVLEPGLTHRGYVLFVARFVPENTVVEFFEAALAIADRIPIVIVGSSGYGGSLDERAAELASSHESISWLGHISDDQRLLSLWQHAAVYFHGHSVGGTNPTLVQAMSAGAPTAARDTSYNREVLEDSGLFFKPDAKSIEKTVLQLAEDHYLQNQLSERALARAKKHYTWDDVGAAYNAVLRDRLN